MPEDDLAAPRRKKPGDSAFPRIARLFRGAGIVNDAGWRVKAESGQTDDTALVTDSPPEAARPHRASL
ncbi:MAG: hypothetical protein IID30_11665 [Planctomycetes bacterium]|nr:hypothetical protein [Planctomycetota bacterium]